MDSNDLDQPVSPSVHSISATVETEDGLVFSTDSKNVMYMESAPQVEWIKMLCGDYLLVFDYVNGTVTPPVYTFDPDFSQFTFIVKLIESASSISNLKFKVLDTSGEVSVIDGVYDVVEGVWICTASFPSYTNIPMTVGVVYDYVWEGRSGRYEIIFTDYTNSVTPNATPCIDPSGFVYEGVPSNRLQDVTVTCYYKDPSTGETVLWDAGQYEQENPLFTDEQGFYRWDVPIGTWQVKYEKEGYQTAYSDWLPVPPPQLDVNIGMKQMTPPHVIKAHAYLQTIDFEFDKYMVPGLLTTDNISVIANGNTVSGKIELLNEESVGTGTTFASRLRFIASKPFDASRVTLKIKNLVESYAGVKMESDYERTFDIEQEMQQIVVDDVIMVPYLDSGRVTVSVLPGAAAAGKMLQVKSLSPMIAAIDQESCILDANGQAVITVNGDLLGMSTLTFSVQDYYLTATAVVNVVMSEAPLKGDVNGDGEVNIGDVNAVINVIMGVTVDQQVRTRADVNGDDEVNIADINELIKIILNPTSTVAAKVDCDDLLHLDDVSIKQGEVRTLSVTLDHADSYSAVQCDVVMPEGLTLLGVSTVSGNECRQGAITGSTTRAVTYSLTNREFEGHDSQVLALTVRADAPVHGESTISLQNVVLADRYHQAWHAQDCTARVNGASGINDLTADTGRVWVEGRILCVKTSQDGVARIVNVNGVQRDITVKAGVNRYELDPGIYVVVLNGNSFKIAVK